MNATSDKSPHELTWKETQDAYLRFNPRVIESQRLSAAYAQLAVRSALVLNGGALFVLPAYISTVSSTDESIPEITLLVAAAFFIAGILTAVLCAYFAYWNYTFHSWDHEYDLKKEIQEIKEGYDTTHQIRLEKARDRWHEDLDDLKAKNGKRINLTAWIGNALGVISYIAFVVGCYFGGRAMLG